MMRAIRYNFRFEISDFRFKPAAAETGSALALLVTRVGANHPDDAFASDDLAVLAQFLDGCADFHVRSVVKTSVRYFVESSNR